MLSRVIAREPLLAFLYYHLPMIDESIRAKRVKLPITTTRSWSHRAHAVNKIISTTWGWIIAIERHCAAGPSTRYPAKKEPVIIIRTSRGGD